MEFVDWFSTLVKALISGAVLALFGAVRYLYKEFRAMQKENHENRLNHQKVQAQLRSLVSTQDDIQDKVNIILQTLLDAQDTAPKRRRK